MATADSPFKGFWTDEKDALPVLEKMLNEGHVDQEQYDQLRQFIEEGYTIIRNAVPEDTVDEVLNDIDSVTETPKRYIARSNRQSYAHPDRSVFDDRSFRLIDFHVNSKAAQSAIFSPKIKSFIENVFGADPLAFQSLTFIYGSQQGVHQDGAYVVVSEPLKFVASWVALEDVSPGSGELVYFPKSHKLPDYLFSGKYKSWNPARDGKDEGRKFIESLKAKIADAGIERETFCPRKGDALIWAADLAHGGSTIENDVTRKSLVTHYCPVDVEPNYKKFSGTFAIKNVGDGHVSSRHYDLRPYPSLKRLIKLDFGRNKKPSFMGKRNK